MSDYAIDCQSRQRFDWIMDHIQADVIASCDEECSCYVTTDGNQIEVRDIYIRVFHEHDDSIEVYGRTLNSRLVMRPDGYIFLELMDDITKCGAVSIQVLTDFGSDEAEEEAHRLYEMFTVFGYKWFE